MESIRQKAAGPVPPRVLPDFRNLGVLLRTLLLVNLLALGTVLIGEREAGAILHAAIIMAGYLELSLFVVVLMLFLAHPLLAAWPLRAGIAAIMGLVAMAAAFAFFALHGGEGTTLWRWLLWSGAVTAVCLFYFDYRSQRYLPALTEARLMALTSRIRPHFLFNSLNAVLGVMRSEPRRAEQVLEELADLFRALMQDNRELVPLGDELSLCERYLDIEQLRLGDRLHVRWILDECPRDAMVPPLMLQPLLENAIYHGVEPSSTPSEVTVRIRRSSGEIRIEVVNPVTAAGASHCGNRMALDNIRERLALFFDLEGRLETKSGGGRYRVSIRLPYRRRSAWRRPA